MTKTVASTRTQYPPWPRTPLAGGPVDSVSGQPARRERGRKHRYQSTRFYGPPGGTSSLQCLRLPSRGAMPLISGDRGCRSGGLCIPCIQSRSLSKFRSRLQVLKV